MLHQPVSSCGQHQAVASQAHCRPSLRWGPKIQNQISLPSPTVINFGAYRSCDYGEEAEYGDEQTTEDQGETADSEKPAETEAAKNQRLLIEMQKRAQSEALTANKKKAEEEENRRALEESKEDG